MTNQDALPARNSRSETAYPSLRAHIEIGKIGEDQYRMSLIVHAELALLGDNIFTGDRDQRRGGNVRRSG